MLKIDLIGRKFGSLLVVRNADNHRRPNGKMVTRVWVKCDCGSDEKIVRSYHLLSEHIKHCSCARERTKHGHSINGVNSPEYNSWIALKRRCADPQHDSYQWYGGRGIQVCDRWLGEEGFLNFIEDMGCKPAKFYTIDRIDVDGNYEPGNCRWATPTEQALNKRERPSHC